MDKQKTEWPDEKPAVNKGHPDEGLCTFCCGYGCDDAGDACMACEGDGHEDKKPTR